MKQHTVPPSLSFMRIRALAANLPEEVAPHNTQMVLSTACDLQDVQKIQQTLSQITKTANETECDPAVYVDLGAIQALLDLEVKYRLTDAYIATALLFRECGDDLVLQLKINCILSCIDSNKPDQADVRIQKLKTGYSLTPEMLEKLQNVQDALKALTKKDA